MRQIQILVPEAFDLETQTWEPESLAEIVEILQDALLQYLVESENQEVAGLANQFSGLIEFFAQSLVSGSRFEQDSPEYHQYRLELAQAILQSWPNQSRAAQEFDWTK